MDLTDYLVCFCLSRTVCIVLQINACVFILFPHTVRPVIVKVVTVEVSVWLNPYIIHIIGTFFRISVIFFLFLFSKLTGPLASHRCRTPHTMSNVFYTLTNHNQMYLIWPSHWPALPRSLCDWLRLTNWVCVGPFQLSAPAFAPLKLRKQTVSLAAGPP